MTARLNATSTPGLYELYGLFDAARLPQRFTLDDGRVLLLSRCGVRPGSLRRNDYWQVDGIGHFEGEDEATTRAFYAGTFSTATSQGVLWSISEEDWLLLFDLHERDMAARLLYRATFQASRKRRRVTRLWVSAEQAEAIAKETGWMLYHAGNVIRRLLRFSDVLSERPFGVREHRVYGRQVDMRSVRTYIHERGYKSITDFSKKSDEFVEVVQSFADANPWVFRALTSSPPKK